MLRVIADATAVVLRISDAHLGRNELLDRHFRKLHAGPRVRPVRHLQNSIFQLTEVLSEHRRVNSWQIWRATPDVDTPKRQMTAVARRWFTR
jgi:hypothetical protein